MRSFEVSGIVFANSNDNLLKKLTAHRSMASVPFGARYRMIDFPLSNLVNAGINNVGIITKENYRSLMDHVGNGVHWELDRKSGGLHLLPPYLTGGAKRYNGTVDALYGARDFIKRCNSELMVLCNGDVLANVDIYGALKFYREASADITIVYSNSISGKSAVNSDTMQLKLDKTGRVTQVEFGNEDTDKPCSIGVIIISRELLLKIIYDSHESEYISFNVDVIAASLKKLKVYGYEHTGYAAIMNGTDSYYSANMDLLNCEVRKQLFNKERPIYTKTRDDMPTRYGTKAKVKNCLIADGCIIEGTVENSVLSRGVRVEKGAVVENCILMQEAVVGKNAGLYNVIADKNALIGEEMTIKGSAHKHFFVKKNQTI